MRPHDVGAVCILGHVERLNHDLEGAALILEGLLELLDLHAEVSREGYSVLDDLVLVMHGSHDQIIHLLKDRFAELHDVVDEGEAPVLGEFEALERDVTFPQEGLTETSVSIVGTKDRPIV